MSNSDQINYKKPITSDFSDGFYDWSIFLVNLYLGLRHLRTDENNILNNLIEKIRKSSYYIYMVCCFLNWSIQLFIICYKAYLNTLTYQYFIYPWFFVNALLSIFTKLFINSVH